MRTEISRPDPTEAGPTRRALDALWERHRHAGKRWLGLGILRELALRNRFELKPVDVRKVARDVPRGAVPDCPSCPQICCGGLENVVSLRLSDLATLVDLGRTDLVSKLKPRFPEDLVAERPGLRDLSESYLWRSLPVLAQLGPERRCAALTRNLQCSLYPHWPISCERFPYTLTPDRRRVRWGTRCPTRKPRAHLHRDRSDALFEATLSAWNERIRDAVLLFHARAELERLGLGPWLCGPDETFTEAPGPLPVL